MEPRSEERELESATDTPSSTIPPAPRGYSGATLGIMMGLGTLLGVAISAVATGLHAGEMVALQRQAAAIESIADSLKRVPPAIPTPSPIASFDPTNLPIISEDSNGTEICGIVDDHGRVRIEGMDPTPCDEYLKAHPWFPDLEGPDL